MMMRKKSKIREMASVLAAGMCLMTVSGCSDAVETQEEVVTLKEQDGEQVSGQMTAEEAAVFGNVAEQVQAPETYQAEVSGDAVSVTIDAVVTIPDVPGIKLKKVTARTFTQEDYDAVDRVLLGSGKLWDQDGEELPAIVTYDETLSETRENELYGYVTADGQDYSLEIDNNATAVRHRVEFQIEKQDGDGNYLSFSNSLPDWDNLPEYMGDIQLEPGFENMNMPPEEIKAEAVEAVSQMGLGEYVVQGGGYFASWIADENAMDIEAYRASTYLARIGYGVHFVRVVDGIPVTYTYSDGGQMEGEDAEKLEQAMLNKDDTTPEIIYWPFEEMRLIYNNDGLRTFKWINPCTIEDLSEEYVFLLPFSDISNIFEEMILKKHADNFNNEGDTVDIQVDRVVLSYMRIREKGSMEGTLIPVWDFFGTKTYKNAAGEVDLVTDRVYDGVLPESMLTINAMDGTIVDRRSGY
ncbi:MAG: hypothetical protein K2J99_15375 [Lachnospiraceae bacterium]|nr:hypothetical protein [Lachnospiraceae bacterium]